MFQILPNPVKVLHVSMLALTCCATQVLRASARRCFRSQVDPIVSIFIFFGDLAAE